MPTKIEIRQKIAKTLSQLENRSEKSRRIWKILQSTEEFQNTIRAEKGIMSYADFKNEVETTRFFPEYFEHYESCSPLVVPYCDGGEIHLFRLKSIKELVPQTLGIPEPKPELRRDPQRAFPNSGLGLVLVPGIAFDLSGGRLGRGAGYYDRFLAKCQPRPAIIAMAFDAQLLETVPREPHDFPMDALITESGIYRFSCRR